MLPARLCQRGGRPADELPWPAAVGWHRDGDGCWFWWTPVSGTVRSSCRARCLTLSSSGVRSMVRSGNKPARWSLVRLPSVRWLPACSSWPQPIRPSAATASCSTARKRASGTTWCTSRSFGRPGSPWWCFWCWCGSRDGRTGVTQLALPGLGRQVRHAVRRAGGRSRSASASTARTGPTRLADRSSAMRISAPTSSAERWCGGEPCLTLPPSHQGKVMPYRRAKCGPNRHGNRWHEASQTRT